MAKIDDGNFGFRSRQAVPQTVQTPASAFDTSGVKDLENGMRTGAANIEYVRAQEQDRAFAASERTRHELDTKIKEENRARSAAALVDYDNSVRQAGVTVGEDLQTGKIQREEVLPKYQEAESKIRAAAMQAIPAEQQEFIAPRLAKASEGVQFGLGKVVEQHRRSTILGYAGSITDGMAKQAIEPGADLSKIHSDYAEAMHVLMPDGGAPPKMVEKTVQDFKDRTTGDYLIARFNERFDDLNGLRDLKKMIGDTKAFPDLDPEKRNALIHTVTGAMAHLEAKQAADQQRVLAELATDMSNTQKAVETGHVASPELMMGLANRTKGTPLEPHFKNLAATNAYIAQFTAAPVAQAEAALLELNGRIGQAKSPDEMSGLISMHSALSTYVNEKQKGLKEDPYATAVQGGAPFVALDFTSQNNLEATVRSRVVAVKAQAKQNPGAAQGIFLEGESRAYKEFLDTQPPAAQAEFLGSMTATISDPVVTAHTMKQLSKDSPMMAQAGWMASIGHKDVAIAILTGEAALSTKEGKSAMTMPGDDKFEDGWRGKVGNAYGGKFDAERMDRESAKRIYAGLMMKEGKSAQTDVNTSIWRKAIDMATGGVAEVNGHNVILPYGMDSSTFKAKAHQAIDLAFQSGEIAGAGVAGNMKGGKDQPDLTTEQRYHAEAAAKAAQTGQQYGLNTTPIKPDTADDVTHGQLSRDYIKDLPLETIGQGVYRVLQGTSSYVMNDEGYPLAIDLRTGAPKYFWDTGNGRVGQPTMHASDGHGGAAAVRGAPIVKDDSTVSPLLNEADPTINLTPEPLSKGDMKRDRKGKGPRKDAN